MSNQEPGPEPTMEHLEIVGRPRRARSGSARRYVVAFLAAGVGAAAVGVGVWAWQAWANQGAQPSVALPGDTLAYAALDLDPPGEQKLAAYNTLRKFPSLKEELGLDSADDLTRSVVDDLASGGDCDLDYGDVKAWIGDRMAVAVVQQTRPEMVVVLQVKDADQARAGLKAVGRGCDGAGFGFEVDGDWAVLARNDDVAAQVEKDAARGSLDDDKDFRALTGAAGDPGLVTLYAAPEAGKALLDDMEKNPFVVWTTTEMANVVLDPLSSYIGLAGFGLVSEPFVSEGQASSDDYQGEASYPSNVSPELQKQMDTLNKRFEHFDELSEQEQRRLMRQQQKLLEKMYGPLDAESTPGEAPDEDFADEGDAEDYADEVPTPELDPALRTALQDFTGLGGVARFADSGLEVEIVGDSLDGVVGDMYAGSAGDDIVSRLPADIAFTFGAGLADGWVDSLMRQLSQQYPFGDKDEAETIKAFEKATGLDVPGDLEALGGENISVVAGRGVDFEQLYDDLAQAPVAVRISGDPDRIEAALDKLRPRLGSDGGPQLVSRRIADDVVVGVNGAFLDDLAKGGDDLGGSALFHKVVPDADKATTVYFMDFDAGDWLAKTASSRDRKDVEPLEAAGLTVTKDKGEQHVLFRLSFED